MNEIIQDLKGQQIEFNSSLKELDAEVYDHSTITALDRNNIYIYEDSGKNQKNNDFTKKTDVIIIAGAAWGDPSQNFPREDNIVIKTTILRRNLIKSGK